ncbi:hypothetical protein MY10362_004215 [Beauveria mimosiformis]
MIITITSSTSSPFSSTPIFSKSDPPEVFHHQILLSCRYSAIYSDLLPRAQRLAQPTGAGTTDRSRQLGLPGIAMSNAGWAALWPLPHGQLEQRAGQRYRGMP